MKAAALRVGLFVLVGTALLVGAVVLVGGRWLAASERALLRFPTSVYGLQVGAPVVFRGVRVGQVDRIGLAPAAAGAVWIPVQASFNSDQLRALVGPPGPGGAGLIPTLVSRGMVARLQQQSLLTGQLYVDLDIQPARTPVAAAAAAPRIAAGTELAEAGLPEIPTATSTMQDLQSQIAQLDIGQIGRDLSAAATAVRQLLAGPELARTLQRAASAAQSLEALAAEARREIGPLSRSAQGALGDSRQALAQLSASAREVAAAASQAQQRLGDQVQGVAQAALPTLAAVQRAADELARAAGGIRNAVSDDSALRQQTDQALQDVSRAARALRELAEMLERQPDALLRGRARAGGER